MRSAPYLLVAAGTLLWTGSLSADDCLGRWDANPKADGVIHYEARMDDRTIETSELSVRCSDFDPPIDPLDGARHQFGVRAVNEFGRSAESMVPFGLPSKPANASVRAALNE